MTPTRSDVYAVVPAAGSGCRMQTVRPKLYLTIGNKTILEYSVMALLAHPRITQVVVTISKDDIHFATLPLARHPQVTVTNGGAERAYSVLAGILAVNDAQWVLVHDAVRPCLHQEDLARLLAISDTSHVGGILAVPVHDTVKRAEMSKNTIIAHTVERVNLWRALTPQFFPRKLLYDCLIYALQKGITITDEASVLEYCGFHPELVEARVDNIKLTYPEDFRLIELYLTYFINQDQERNSNANWTRI